MAGPIGVAEREWTTNAASHQPLFEHSYSSSRVDSSGPSHREDTRIFLVQLVALDNSNTPNIQSILVYGREDFQNSCENGLEIAGVAPTTTMVT